MCWAKRDAFHYNPCSNEVMLQQALQKLPLQSSQMRPEFDHAERERKSGSEIFTMT